MIRDVLALPVYNSRGDQTIKIWLTTDNGVYTACAPCGKSKGRWEAKELSVKQALKAFPKVRKQLLKMREDEYKIIDEILEELGGKMMGRIGSNLSTAVSMACVRAAAGNHVYRFLNSTARSFPFPLGNAIGGGAHGGFTTMQEFLAIPVKAKSIEEAIETNISIWKDVGKELRLHGYSAGRNDEGAWVSRMNDLRTLDMLSRIAGDYGARLGIDVAASQFYKKGTYHYHHIGRHYDTGDQINFMEHLVKTYRLAYLEDPFHENDWKSFVELRRRVDCLVVGDDLYATNPQRLAEGIKKEAGNGIIIKPDQIGTVSRAMQAAEMAKEGGFAPIVSHRSGETPDTFISDLAVAVEAPLIKCGIAGGERVEKANRLIEIWKSLSFNVKPRMSNFRFK